MAYDRRGRPGDRYDGMVRTLITLLMYLREPKGLKVRLLTFY